LLRGVLTSVVVHLWGFNSCTQRESARARSLQSYSSVIILCSSRFFQVERSESPSLRARSLVCSSVRHYIVFGVEVSSESVRVERLA
jgi:hypothetical protein